MRRVIMNARYARKRGRHDAVVATSDADADQSINAAP